MEEGAGEEGDARDDNVEARGGSDRGVSKLMEIDAAGVAYDDGNAPTNKAPV